MLDPLLLSFQAAVAGRYSLEREIGRGGMGVVYLAREVRLDRSVAIKLLPPEFAGESRLRERFLSEARLAARLSHPYIVPIHAVDEIGGFVFYVMAFVDGETLAQRVARKGPLTPGEATRTLREVAWALAYAHSQGVVHRDVKPANILLERGTGRAMVTDFGIARLTMVGGATAAGELLGTPDFMSPEQASGDAVDGRSDLYSLGITGYFALTGSLPFSAPSAHAMLAAQMTKPPPPVATVARGVPRPLAQAIDRCLEKDPAARFERGEALADALAPALEKKTDVPVPIRIFLDRRRMAPVMIVPFFVMIWLGPALTFGFGISSPGLTFALLAMSSVTAPLLIVLFRLRRLLKLGYGPEDIAAGMRGLFHRKREEFLFEYGSNPSLRERVARTLGAVGLVAAASTGIAILAAAQLRPPRLGTWSILGPILVVSLQVGILASVFAVRWRRLRRGTAANFWVRFWRGRPGHLLARMAAIRLGQRAVVADRPTEMAIASSAESMYESLPKPVRTSIGDVPVALRALQAAARAARARIDELDAALVEAQHTPARTAGERHATLTADLRAARARAEDRLSEVVGALENIRLDLLRLHAGAGTTDGLTRDLEAARVLSEDVDRLIVARREVDAALDD